VEGIGRAGRKRGDESGSSNRRGWGKSAVLLGRVILHWETKLMSGATTW